MKRDDLKEPECNSRILPYCDMCIDEIRSTIDFFFCSFVFIGNLTRCDEQKVPYCLILAKFIR